MNRSTDTWSVIFTIPCLQIYQLFLMSRYINHSCEPNCVAEIVTFEREKKIIIISKRKIQQGEEVNIEAFFCIIPVFFLFTLFYI